MILDRIISDNLCEKKRPCIGIYTRTPDERSSDSFYSLIRLRRIKETRSLRNQDHQGLRRQMCKVCLRSRAKCEIISHLVIFLRFLFRY